MDRTRRMIDREWCRELVTDTGYFMVLYRQPGVNLPEIQTFVYLGASTFDDDSPAPGRTAFLFQDAGSFQEDGDWRDLSADARKVIAPDKILRFDEESITGVADIDGLLVLLQGLRRRMVLGLGWDRILPEEDSS
jgi:hypothetical protein